MHLACVWISDCCFASFLQPVYLNILKGAKLHTFANGELVSSTDDITQSGSVHVVVSGLLKSYFTDRLEKHSSRFSQLDIITSLLTLHIGCLEEPLLLVHGKTILLLTLGRSRIGFCPVYAVKGIA